MPNLHVNQVKCADDWKTKCQILLETKEKFVFSGDQVKANALMKTKQEEQKKLNITEAKIKETEKLIAQLEKNKTEYCSNSDIISLYKLISKVTFDLEKAPTQISGFILRDSVKLFDFDPSKCSKQYIIDHLWKLIETE